MLTVFGSVFWTIEPGSIAGEIEPDTVPYDRTTVRHRTVGYWGRWSRTSNSPPM
ncbi:MAG: hypothetical protein ACI9F9_003473 [Candidatus Paceibacteria bacterium]|jgi:hypothetical protein